MAVRCTRNSKSPLQTQVNNFAKILDGLTQNSPGENVGSYLITPSGLTSANYAITFNTGMLTITAAPAPVILPLTGAGTANVVITWSAVSNVTYRVQYKSDLNSAWVDLVY